MPSHFLSPQALLLCACFTSGLPLLVGCRKALPDRLEITEQRQVFASEGDIPEPAEPMQRLGTGSQTQFKWQTPAGWKLVPGTEMRQINYRLGPNQEGECYLSITNGEEGATLQEINRWRKQMAQPPVEIEAISTLPQIELLKRPCPLLALEGNYTPAGGMMKTAVEELPDYGLRGVALEIPAMRAVLTVKMVGPKALVLAEDANFKTFVTSLTPNLPKAAQP